ncbi:LOW QUALITY PROTEIN: complement C3 [Eublepharis macularius]|uniref:LOW QUALITY PROTEIN: complement C3 n=1 Tax=Eublepharis macularius TaxID=481883 RepID=A0AA97KLC6_EUBMA|nr:LOW QUALITY PROTEIN: complement C3 [Eublepharis macularius]
MEGLALCLAAVLVVCFPASSHSQLYSLITPNILRVESEEKIVVEAHGLNVQTEVTITVYDFPQKKKALYLVQASLQPDNGMMVTPTIKVPAKDMKKDSKLNQYVVVQARCAQFQLEKVVLVSFQSGYIFLQTDKTIYTPGSSVRYRVFPVGYHLEPLNKNVIVEFETPEGIIVHHASISSVSTNTQPFNIPEIVSFGTWKVVAKYQDSPQQNFTTQFEVKEYVLPSFEVMLLPHEKFYNIESDEDFRVSINARFLYGKKVTGVALVLFGVIIDGEKNSIPDSLDRIPIVEGEGEREAVLTKRKLQERFRQPAKLSDLIGQFLYISVTVMTESGSDMVVAEYNNIKIVTSPYNILFTKTPKYFKPGMPYELTVFVTNPDGSPAPNIPVVSQPIQADGVTQNDGTAKLILNMPANTQQQRITVRTKHGKLQDAQQASNTILASAYQTQGQSGNYLHLAVTARELKSGDNLPINFNVKSNNPQVLNQIRYFTYIIMTKGKIFKTGRQPKGEGQNLVTMSLPITPDLIPSFRIVAYFQIGNSEIVADSVWVDVKDTCMGTLVVTGATEADNDIHLPGTRMKIKLEGDANAHVGLVAVDKGVYVLNKKYKLTQSKIWDTVEKSDIGCTAGSGSNNVGVFADAGLTLETSNQISTPQRSDPKCQQVARRRRRRSLQLLESKASKVARYQDRRLRKCCEDGMQDNPMGHSCEKRAEYIEDQNECKTAFLECCRYIKSIRDEKAREEQLILSRSDIDDGFLTDDQIVSRTEFPESWLWQMERLDTPANDAGISSKTVSVFLKDSITTWEVLAVSLSETKGVCVADPYEIVVRKDFFIDLKVPYSVVRNEQVEIRAVLYNYRDQDITVRVELIHNPVFCSASTSKERYRQTFNLKGQSSKAVPFVIVPLQQGLHDIEVKAAVWGQFVSDGVKKKLKVVTEGMQKKLVTVIELDPTRQGVDGVQEQRVNASNLDDIVPDSETVTQLTIQGNPVAQIIENSIDGANLKHLIVTPSGCGEQNMITMTPSVIATHYLDATGQWEKIGVDRRTAAVKQINQGYAQQLAYKKADNSYAAFKDRAASTWLTAYVAKVFAMAKSIESNIDTNVICGAVKWLILEKQKPDGVFQEDAPVIHGEMVGGYKGAEPDMSLTAFVLIALLESRSICGEQINSLENSINKAADYLARKYDTLERPYTVALTSYALILAEGLNHERVLMRASKDGNRWEERGAHTYNIEGSSYGLLALLKLKKFDQAAPVVRWLTAQNYYGGTYGHTQSTIMVFQALAQYQTDIPLHKDMELDVSLLLPGRAAPVRWRIDYESALLARSEETKINEDFTVKATGQGQATMTVVTLYNAKLREEAAPCKNFDLEVTATHFPLGKAIEGVQGAIKIKICARYQGLVDSTMTIIDVSMLTGYGPATDDLKKLSEGVDRYISKFEIDNTLSERGNLIIYLDKVSHVEDECLEFKAYKYFDASLIQPGSVTVYSYYSIDDRCTKFYHPDSGSEHLNKICHGDVCRCAEENCYLQSKADEAVDLQMRVQQACRPDVDYVYKTKLVQIEEENGYDNYMMQVLEVIKEGTDVNPQAKLRKFISHMKCREALHLEKNKEYLILGHSKDLWPTKTDVNYIISKDTWIEKWPTEDECQEEEYQNLCNDFIEFSNRITIFGCDN